MRTRRTWIIGFGIGCLLAWTVVAAPQEGAAVPDPEAARWVEALKSSDLRVRMEAAYTLPLPKTDVKKRVEALVQALEDRSPVVRGYAAAALGEIAREPSLAVPALIKALSDPDRIVRQHATLALVKIGEPAVPALAELVGREAGVSPPRALNQGPALNQALFALEEIGAPAVPELLRLLERKYEPRLQQFVNATLTHIGRPAVPQLTKALGHPSRKVCRSAITVLSTLKRDGEAAVPNLAAIFRGQDEELAFEAGQALGKMGPAGLQVLFDALKEKDDDLRVLSLNALLASEVPKLEGAREVLPLLVKAAGGRSDRVRRRAIASINHVLPGLGAESKPALPTLTKAFGDELLDVRLDAIHSLGLTAKFLGKEAGDSIPMLIRALSDPEPKVRLEASLALAQAGEAAAPALPRLLTLLRDSKEDYQLRINAVRAIGAAGVAEDAPVEALILTLTKDSVSSVRGEAVAALGRLSKNPRAVTALVEALRQDDFTVSPRATETLGQVGPDALPALATAFKDPKLDVRSRAMTAVETMAKKDPTNPAVRETFQEALKDEQVRSRAVYALGRLGKSAEPAVPALALVLSQSKPGAAYTPLVALEAIGPAARKAIPALKEFIAKAGPLTDRAQGVRTLTRIDPEAAVPLVREWLAKETAQPELMAPILPLLGKSGVSLFREVLAHPLPSVRRAATVALGASSAGGADDVLALKKLLADGDAATRVSAAQALGGFGAKAEKAVPALVHALREDLVASVRQSSAKALGLTGTRSKEAGEALAAALSDSSADVQVEAAQAVIRVGFETVGSRKVITAIATDRFVNGYASSLVGRYGSGTGGGYGYRAAEFMLMKAPAPKAYSGNPFTESADVPTSDDVGESAPTLRSTPVGHGLPEFPWPPPYFSDYGALKRESLGFDQTSLMTIHTYLLGQLKQAGFPETRLFQAGPNPQHGFVLLTRRYRVSEDGSLFGGGGHVANNFRSAGVSDSLDQVGSLFREKSGKYRMFALVICRDPKRPDYDPSRPVDEVEARFLSGVPNANELPEYLRTKKFAGFFCHALVFEYERTPAEGTRLMHAEVAGTEVEKQLEKSNLKVEPAK